MEMHTRSYWVSLDEKTPIGFSKSEIQTGMLGLSNILSNTAPLYLMCSPSDISVVYQVKSTFAQKPTLYIYESYPGGVGFSEKLFSLHNELLNASRKMILACGCEMGCPSCVGPQNDFPFGSTPKLIALKLIDHILEGK